jgi:hypothetical protein
MEHSKYHKIILTTHKRFLGNEVLGNEVLGNG